MNVAFENSWNKFEDFIREYMRGYKIKKII